MKSNESILKDMKLKMEMEEKSEETIYKYLRDAKAFLGSVNASKLSKEDVIAYKRQLGKRYAVGSANSIIASVNYLLRSMGKGEYAVKAFKVQKASFRDPSKELTKEEYFRLLDAAESKGNTALSLIMQTICSTGIRVGELQFITVEAVKDRRAIVSNKGKKRTVLLPYELCVLLKDFARDRCVSSGSVFITKNGRPVDRNNIAHAMKGLSFLSGVDERKIFPHNLRHLFAVTYYEAEKDLTHLADILGHSNINTTRIYTMVSCDRQEEQINHLGLCRLYA